MTTPRTRRRDAVIAGAVLALALSASTAGAQTDTTAPPITAPGRLVDVGGWRLHVHCTGEPRAGQPTVILEAGMGDFSVDWSLVQPRVAAFAHVCSYDRAGSGWSDLGPRPRTLKQIAYELRTLLRKTDVPPPYIFVGHSYGGLLVRAYHGAYATDVAGMVLVDAGHEDDLMYINGRIVRESEMATGRPVPPVRTANPLRESDIPPQARERIEAAARGNGPHAADPPYDKLPPDARRMRVWALSQVKHYAANDNPFAADEKAQMAAERKASAFPLGDLPLVVLTRDSAAYAGPQQEQREAERVKHQAELARLSRRGRRVVARGSGHHIQLDDPALVVTAIRGVLSGTKR